MTDDEALMTKEFPNDPMPDASYRLLIRALNFFRHSGLGIGHFAERHGSGLRVCIFVPVVFLINRMIDHESRQPSSGTPKKH
jgi:hypothetical protein